MHSIISCSNFSLSQQTVEHSMLREILYLCFCHNFLWSCNLKAHQRFSSNELERHRSEYVKWKTVVILLKAATVLLCLTNTGIHVCVCPALAAASERATPSTPTPKLPHFWKSTLLLLLLLLLLLACLLLVAFPPTNAA